MKSLMASKPNDACCSAENDCHSELLNQTLHTLPMVPAAVDDAPCCGAPPGLPSSPFERPGYQRCQFVADFKDTCVGFVPQVKTRLLPLDYGGSLKARLGIARDQYKIAPGLYCVGSPGSESDVLVTANYKLTFDVLRSELLGCNVWLLVLDTRGVNVWCAAGKQTFSTAELVRQVEVTQLSKVINHHRLILPQLGAPGVSAHEVMKVCGFRVVWGPIRATDVRQFLANSKKATPEMRRLSFSLVDRLILVPVELSLIMKPSLWVVGLLFILSGISSDLFSLTAAWNRGLAFAAAYGMGVLAGAVMVPALLPWLPPRSFYLKGGITGLIGGGVIAYIGQGKFSILELTALVLTCLVVSSYAAMNFTGATPFTSPSGVEQEMRFAIPLQGFLVVTGLVCWLAAVFVT